ncbi:MAG: T9SS type A sorting domain-containing protein [Ignavibacteriales bacterium]|nr:T9SS type A sorting domain-containing protein [Ignavibacteriales bacterium]
MSKYNLFVFTYLFTNFSFTINCQTIQTWKTTTVNDFTSFSLNNLRVTEESDGEIQLDLPLKKVYPDYEVNYFPKKFIYYKGRYYNAYIKDKNVYVQEYDSNFVAIEAPLIINNNYSVDSFFTDDEVRFDFLNSGYFLVIWKVVENTISGNELIIYAQVIKDGSARIGKNFKINVNPKLSYWPIVMGNNYDNTFWLICTDFSPDGGQKMFVQRIDIWGNVVGNKFQLNQETISKYEHVNTFIKLSDNTFIITWEAYQSVDDFNGQLYLKKFDKKSNSISPVIKVGDDNAQHWQGESIICLDDNSLLLVIWTDYRDTNPILDINGRYNIYAQCFDSSLSKIGKNFRVNATHFQTNDYPFVYYKNKLFWVTWKAWGGAWGDDGRPIIKKYQNQWKFSEVKEGILTSVILDTKNLKTKYLDLSWEDSTTTNTAIKFKIRSSEMDYDLDKKKWYGPINENDFYTIKEGQSINSIHNGDRYLQYQAYFNSKKNGESPVLKSVSIDFMKDNFLESTVLYQNYPNPFNSSTIINFHLSTESYVTLTISNLLGEVVDRLLEKTLSKDNYKINWSPKSLSSGVYFYTLETYSILGRNFQETKKMIVVK